MHTCVGRLRYLGVLLYDADRIKEVAALDDKQLIAGQLEIYMDPGDPEVIKAAREAGIPDSTMDAARKSPVWKFVREWGLALPLHPEFRTIPNLFYVPPLLPAIARMKNQNYDSTSLSFWDDERNFRLSAGYMAQILAAGNEDLILNILKKLMSVRIHRRALTVGDISSKEAEASLQAAGYTPEIADAVYRMTSLVGFGERFVIPPAHREEAIEMIEDTGKRKGATGFGFMEKPKRGL